MKTLEHAAKKYYVKFIIYHHDDNERLDYLNTIGESENKHNLLMISGKPNYSSKSTSKNTSENESENIIVHVMYIKDIQKYTKLHICPKCGYVPPATNNKSYHKDRFKDHVENYNGNLTRKLCLNEQSVSFIPHIQKNPVLFIF
jgi:hypothetical protein